MRRFTRLTNAFSKKVENHAYAVALHIMYYNFVRIHQKLRVTPAMAAGVSEKLWEIGDIAKLVEDAEAPAKKRGTYKARGLTMQMRKTHKYRLVALLALGACNASTEKILLVCGSHTSALQGATINVDAGGLSVHEELDLGNGCINVFDAKNGVRGALTKLVNCPYALSDDPDDQIVEISSEKIVFGAKNSPQVLDRSTGALRGANGVTVAICTPATTNKKF